MPSPYTRPHYGIGIMQLSLPLPNSLKHPLVLGVPGRDTLLPHLVGHLILVHHLVAQGRNVQCKTTHGHTWAHMGITWVSHVHRKTTHGYHMCTVRPHIGTHGHTWVSHGYHMCTVRPHMGITCAP